ncbi:SusD/RagB family nutrient-binding outer membrane lipoprotein [Aggregatimonas sangjinii]|uniref:SusD/RagB family nutrient-binding outer membrane lipoprotein n=1 Tax=Aggregatimonas sangjinii TaxID=2583587 RepID=A0A5B7SVN5_9FLAO|nr:SusD/RagB family nutrient-binding outer membrane lipoprotein [Aggregatimonas sangjinii]QCX01078.1 SusD/RagB family nutrient-binding outer membrane lipoprotein [Aggregatimonas sangjinii]
MKKIIKFIAIVFATGIVFNSCETTELDLASDPNALTPSQANPDFYLNTVQETFARTVESLGENGAELTRIENMFGRNYQNVYSPASVDNEWEQSYQEVIKNIRDMNVLAEEAELFYHIGMGQVMEAYTITLLVDFFGDVPYSEAIQAPEILNPAVDSGADIYAAALALLDQATENFNATPSALPQNDFFYNGDADAWIRAINTLKLRLYLNTGNIDAFDEIVDDEDDFISSTDEDFQFQWGSNLVQPDTRHPNYAQTYTAQGAQGDYASIWLMDLMDTSDDPRIRYYFYRQSATVPGAPGVAPNEETLACSLTDPPAHYVAGGYEYCSLPNGYWGRDHGNDEGTPPDGFLRVAPGVYPQAGQFDDDSFGEIALGSGGGGAGITPMLLASTVDFWRAEVAMSSSTSDALELVLDGIEKSIAKVQSFGSVDSSADGSLAPTPADNQAYLTNVGAEFNDVDASTDDQWNILAEQFFIALKGNGHDSYNFYRRTGYPNDIQPNVEPNPGAFIRSLFYPANAANNNQNVTQKAGVTEQVFWDTNPASPAFPPAN